jgi:integrase-like protein
MPPTPTPPPRLLDRVRAALRTRHCSLRTEKAYVGWIRRFILFHDKRHPAQMGAPEITRFLSALAIERNVAASTQNQALSARSSCRGWTTSCAPRRRCGSRWC